MSPFAILCIAMGLFVLLRAIRSQARRGGNFALAGAWGIWAVGSITGLTWLYGVGLVVLGLAIYLIVTWPRRALKEIQRLAGLSDEDVLRLEETALENEKRWRKEAERKAAAEAAEKAFWEDFRVEARGLPVEGIVTVEVERRFPSEGGGELVFPAGSLTLRLRLEDAKWSEEGSTLRVVLFVRDSDSTLWRGESIVNWNDVLDEALDCPRGESGEGIHAWASLPDPWMKAMRESCRITGATALLDSRNYYDLRLGDRVYTVREKYQGPQIDLAWLEADSTFLVRVSRMYAVADQGEGDIEDLPPFVFDLPFSKLVLAANSGIHWRSAGDWFEFESEERPLPIFSKTEEAAGLPPSQVRFVAA